MKKIPIFLLRISGFLLNFVPKFDLKNKHFKLSQKVKYATYFVGTLFDLLQQLRFVIEIP